MLFVELRFFVFFAIVFGVYWLLRSNDYRKYLLTLASYVFYGAWDWRFLGLIWLITGVCYVVGLNVGPSNLNETVRKRWLAFGVIFSLIVLGVFKYFNFFADSFVDAANIFGLSVNQVTLQLVLPVGISFYTFQAISYILDVSRGDIHEDRSFSDIAFYIAFFPQLVAGPIVRASTFIPQMEVARRWSDVNVRFCFALFLIGFIKKACISDNIAPYVDMIFADPSTYTGATIVGGVFLYGVQIYCDFSGYSDMAIACAGILGYVFPANFNSPYLAYDIQNFWRRWHISLSSWLRDYLYIPLGGSRCSPVRHKINLMTTMLLGGLWHGASYNFIIWGGLHGSAQIAESYWRKIVASRVPSFGFMGPLIGGVVTFWWVNLAWIFFRAPTLGQSWEIVKSYVTWQSVGTDTLPINLWAVLACLLAVHWLSNRFKLIDWFQTISPPRYVLAYGAVAALAFAFIPLGYRPFVYFQF